MTVSMEQYFAKRRPQRKKEPRYLAVIDKDSCTSCTACASMCPVDCIYEVVRPQPAASFHQIDTSRCIGCQLCYRIPSESTERFTLEVCPWNAIDLIHNPNVAEREPWLRHCYCGDEAELPWGKLEEYGYQLHLNGEVRVPQWAGEAQAALVHFTKPCWGHRESPIAITREPETHDGYVLYAATDEGLELLRYVFRDYPKVFLD